MNDCEVLVVGAGPTGLTVAVELARRGVDVRVVEKEPRYPTGTRARGLSPRSMEIMADLGVAERLVADGSTDPVVIRMYDRRGRFIDVRVGAEPSPTRGAPYPRGVLCATWQVEAALRDRLAEHGVTVELDSAVQELEQDEHGVTAVLRSGDGTTRRVRAAYLVGADGGRSTVRKLLGLSFPGRGFGDMTLLVADLAVSGMSRENVHHSWRRGATLAPNPHDDTFWFSTALFPDADGTLPEPSLELCQELFHQRTGRTEVRFTAAPWMSTYRFSARMVDRYRSGHAFVAGDAAHIHIPAGGQGMQTGIQDGYNLGWKLAAVLRGADPELLDSYQAERRPVAARLLASSTRRGLVMLAQGLVMWLATRVRPVGTLFWRWWTSGTDQLDVAYRGSALSREVGRGWSSAWGAVSGSGRSRLRAGDRVPDLPLWDTDADAEVRLFDVLRGPHWTVLGVGADSAATVAAVRDRFGGQVRGQVVVVERAEGVEGAERSESHGGTEPGLDEGRLRDRDRRVRTLLGGTDGTVFVVRPDGHLGLAGRADVATVVDYLEGKVARAARMAE